MRHLEFWFDPISPYAALAFERLPEVLQGLSAHVSYRPVLFAGLLKHWGQLGPAEIGPKRTWTYRQVTWLAHRHGIELTAPAAHPFDPLPLLRLAWACASPAAPPPGGAPAAPNRWVVESILRHVWRGGGDAADPQRLADLTARLQPTRDPAGAEVKQALRDATDAAIARGIFGVPTTTCDGRSFWGLDGLEMLAAWLHGDPWFAGTDWDQAAAVPIGVSRRR
jgi:2-hydroxychromene-2-carboxylate isomerase